MLLCDSRTLSVLFADNYYHKNDENNKKQQIIKNNRNRECSGSSEEKVFKSEVGIENMTHLILQRDADDPTDENELIR